MKGGHRMIDIAQAKEKIYNHNSVNPYVDITPYELQVGFPIVKYSGFFPQAGEVIVYAVPSATFKDQEKIVAYAGRSSGASVRVAKGLTVRTGSSRGNPIRNTVRKHNSGDLIVTNKRIVFIGKDDSFDFPIDKISATKPLTLDSFVLQSGSSSKNIYVNSKALVYAMGFINYVTTSYNQGIDVVAEKQQTDNEMTDEQRELCDTVSQEVRSTSAIKTPKQKRGGCFTKILLGVLLFFVAILIGVIIYGIVLGTQGNTTDSQDNGVETQQYTDKEIIYKEIHPLIYASFEDTKEFYKGIDKVKVVSVADHAAIERNLDSLTGDENILYFIQDATHKNFVGSVQINLFSPEVIEGVNIEKAVSTLTDYLMKDFNKYYSQDSCYKYTQKNVTVYTYSCRLNDVGAEYHNNGHPELPAYYYLTFVHYEDTNQWKLETGCSAYGGKGKEWIEKYAQPWDIDMNAYLSN